MLLTKSHHLNKITTSLEQKQSTSSILILQITAVHIRSSVEVLGRREVDLWTRNRAFLADLVAQGR